MKKFIIFTMLQLIAAGIIVVSCNSDENYYDNKVVTEDEELNGFFNSVEYKDFSNTFKVNIENFDMDKKSVKCYANKNVKTYFIPIKKGGREIGQILIVSKNNGRVYKVLYENRNEFDTENGGTIEITTSTNDYIASVVCKKIGNQKIAMKIVDVNTINTFKVKTRAEGSSSESWLECTSNCYKMAMDACGTDSQCDFLCDLANVAAGCTLSVAAACAIHCI